MADTLGGLEMELYQKNPALWGITKALKFAPKYKQQILDLLDEQDRTDILAYSAKIRAVKVGIQAAKR